MASNKASYIPSYPQHLQRVPSQSGSQGQGVYPKYRLDGSLFDSRRLNAMTRTPAVLE